MHVLRQVHKALNPHGLLLDIHPQPEDPRVEIDHGGHSVPVGRMDWTQDSEEIRQARRRLVSTQRDGLFRLERRRRFDLRAYHDSVDAWLEYVTYYNTGRGEDASNRIPSSILRGARRELSRRGGRVVVIERVRASALRRCE